MFAHGSRVTPGSLSFANSKDHMNQHSVKFHDICCRSNISCCDPFSVIKYIHLHNQEIENQYFN